MGFDPNTNELSNSVAHYPTWDFWCDDNDGRFVSVVNLRIFANKPQAVQRSGGTFGGHNFGTGGQSNYTYSHWDGAVCDADPYKYLKPFEFS